MANIGWTLKVTALLVLLVCATQVECGRDYYEILGVNRDASDKQISKAWRKLSIELHPDKHPEREAEYVEASSVLHDPDKRKVYDQYGEEGLKGNQGGGGGGFNPFEMFFGGGHRHQGGGGAAQMQKGPDVEMDLEVTLQDLYLGRTLEVVQKKQQLCQKCRGTGAKKASDVTTCSGCKGTGMKVKVQQLGPGFVQQTQTVCDECGGKGKKVTSTCPHCGGKKVEIGEDTITIFVERGMQDGEKIVFEGQSDEAPDSTPGDLIFRLVTVPHKKFVRKGDDLHYPLTISLLEALVGFTKKIKHLDGHIVEISRSEVTKPGQILTVSGEGMPMHNFPSQTGNLYVEITVKFPATVTEEQKEGGAKRRLSSWRELMQRGKVSDPGSSFGGANKPCREGVVGWWPPTHKLIGGSAYSIYVWYHFSRGVLSKCKANTKSVCLLAVLRTTKDPEAGLLPA